MTATIDLNGRQYRLIDVTVDNVDEFMVRRWDCDGYHVVQPIAYYSKRYKRWICMERGDRSDGATGARDINSFSWLVHDDLCEYGVFENLTRCTNWQASQVLSDILKAEGRWFRARTWFWATWLFGGGEARKNGMR